MLLRRRAALVMAGLLAPAATAAQPRPPPREASTPGNAPAGDSMDEILRGRGNPSGRVGGATRGPDDPPDSASPATPPLAPRPPTAADPARPATR